MRDNEIIKALENIVNEKIGCCKEDCNFYDGKVHSCEKTIAKHSLDLINRQKAEIEALKMDNKQLQSDVITANQYYEHTKELLEKAIKITQRSNQRFIEAKKELQVAKAEIERLTAQRDKAVKDFTEFAQRAYENPFACERCVHSVSNGRGCLWKGEHEDESCLGRHFEYRGTAGAESGK